MEFKFGVEFINALIDIKNAILGKNGNEGGGGNNENYTWYDFIRDNIIKPFDDHLERVGKEDINPVPVAIIDFYNNNFRLLKDIPISQPIVNSGIFLYDTPPRLGNSYTTYGGSPTTPNSGPWGFSCGYAANYDSIISIEINGNTYYYTENPGD